MVPPMGTTKLSAHVSPEARRQGISGPMPISRISAQQQRAGDLIEERRADA